MGTGPRTFNPNRQLKEDFVSNLSGSSMLEIAALSAIVPILMVLRRCWGSSSVNVTTSWLYTATTFFQLIVGILFYQLTVILIFVLSMNIIIVMSRGQPLFQLRWEISSKKNGELVNADRKWRMFFFPLVMDFFFVLLPMSLVFTILSDWAYLLAGCLIFLLIVSILIKRCYSPLSPYVKGGTLPSASVRSSISSYRVSMMIVTSLCILAVDFNIYPRRYAKTETYGTGLMDLGVGSFVVANALVSKQARNITTVKLKTVLRSISPLLLFGFGRLIFTSELDYQVHVGEYGVHWNFFFTLAGVSFLTSIFSIHPDYCGVLGSIILTGYQICLSCGLNKYLLSNRRSNHILSKNKEGIFSIFGYWGMYLIGVQLGHYLYFRPVQTSHKESFQWAKMRVWFLCSSLWLLTVIFDMFIERVSRRMCNLAYVTLVFAQNLQVLAIFMLSDFLPGSNISVLEKAVNQNLLGFFILANVLTGVLNLSVDTLSASPLMSFSILVGYATILSAFAVTAMSIGIRLKFW